MRKEILSSHVNFSHKIRDYKNGKSKLSHFKRCKIHTLDDEWDSDGTLNRFSYTYRGDELYDICDNINRIYGMSCTLHDIIKRQNYIIERSIRHFI